MHEVQWLKDEAPLHLDETRMTIFPSGSIEIDDVTVPDGGSYQCKVTSGTDSKYEHIIFIDFDRS